MKYKVIEMKELTREILEEMLAEAYEDGYRDGRGSTQITYRSPSFDQWQDPYRITLCGKEVKTDSNESIATNTNANSNTSNITCTNSVDATNVKSITNAVHASVAHQNNTITGYQPRTSVFKTNIIPPKGTKCEDV